MGTKTNISYIDHTWSPWIGCTKISEGCLNCYASTMSKRAGKGWGNVEWGKGKPRHRCSDKNPLL